MSGQSLGLIETVGLAVAVEAADAAMKSANVELVGYELTKGGGLVIVKLTGEVGAINAAVAAGVAAASRIGDVYAWKVIARTATGIDNLIASQETCGVPPLQPVAPEPADAAPSVSEPKAPTIPVVTVEPVAQSSGCADVASDVSFVASVNQPLPAGEQVRRQVAEERDVEVESVAVENVGQGDKKPLRTRGKTTRK